MDTVPVRHLPGTDTAPGVFYLCLELVPRVLHVAAAEDERGGSAAKRRKVLHSRPAAARPPLALNPQPLMMPEILRVIFCYCDTATLVCCGAVCRTWLQALVEHTELWQRLAKLHIAPVFKPWADFANGPCRQNPIMLGIAAYSIFSGRCFYCGAPTQWYFVPRCIRVCRKCFHKRSGPVELCTLAFACNETGMNGEQLSGLSLFHRSHGRDLGLPEAEENDLCTLVDRHSVRKLAEHMRRQSSNVDPVEKAEELQTPTQASPPTLPWAARRARQRRPLSLLRPASWADKNIATSSGALTDCELSRDAFGPISTSHVPAHKSTRHVARRHSIVPPSTVDAVATPFDDNNADDHDFAIITRPTTNTLRQHYDRNTGLWPLRATATAHTTGAKRPTPACTKSFPAVLHNPVSERQAADTIHPLSSLMYYMVHPVPDSPRPTLVHTYAASEAELLDALSSIQRMPYNGDSLVTVVLAADIELSEPLQPQVPLMLQGRCTYTTDDNTGNNTAGEAHMQLRRPRLSMCKDGARTLVVATGLLTLMGLDLSQQQPDALKTYGAVAAPGCMLTMVDCLVRVSGAAVRASEGAQVALRNCRLIGTSVGVEQPECDDHQGRGVHRPGDVDQSDPVTVWQEGTRIGTATFSANLDDAVQKQRQSTRR